MGIRPNTAGSASTLVGGAIAGGQAMHNRVARRFGPAFALIAVPAVGLAQSHLPSGQQTTPKPANHRSFVTDRNHVAVAFDSKRPGTLDPVFADQIATFWPGREGVDIVMAQCFGGGFVDSVRLLSSAQAPVARLAAVSFNSASRYCEVANSFEIVGTNPPVPTFLDNHPRAWINDFRLNNDARVIGMGRAALSAFSGRPGNRPVAGLPAILAIAADPSAPGGRRWSLGDREIPQYFSPDPANGVAIPVFGPNNERDFHLPVPNPNNVRQYAILVAWSDSFTVAGVSQERHALNITRMYRTLTEVYNVPRANIVVMYGGFLFPAGPGPGVPAWAVGRFRPYNDVPVNDGQPYPAPGVGVLVDARNTADDWRAALRPNTFYSTPPDANSRLLIFCTGHGGLAIIEGGKIKVPNAAERKLKFPECSWAKVLVGSTESAVLLQLTSRAPLQAESISVRVDGHSVGTLGPPVPGQVRSLEGIVDGPSLFHYHLTFDRSSFDLASAAVQIEFEGVVDSSPQGDLLAACTLVDEEQQCVLVLASGPSNDHCADAKDVSEGVFPFDTSSASPDGSSSCGGNTSPTVWFRYIPSRSGLASVSTCGLTTLDTVLAVFRGTCSGAEAGCSDDAAPGTSASLVEIPVSQGEPILIRVGGKNSADGRGDLSVAISDAECINTGGRLEPEPCGQALDNGCDGPGNPSFVQLNCGGDVVLGSSFAGPLANQRDPDWYSINVAEAGPLLASVRAEFPVHLSLQTFGCPSQIIEGAFAWSRCTETASIAATVAPGSYCIVVAPAGTSGVMCGSTANYLLTVVSACAPACIADTDDGSGSGTPDGGVTIDDLLFYLMVFEQGDLRSDVDDGSSRGTPDGGVTIDDLLYYLLRFEAGC